MKSVLQVVTFMALIAVASLVIVVRHLALH